MCSLLAFTLIGWYLWLEFMGIRLFSLFPFRGVIMVHGTSWRQLAAIACFMLCNFVVSWHWICVYSLFFKQEMELSLIGLQNAGKTSLVNVVAVITKCFFPLYFVQIILLVTTFTSSILVFFDVLNWLSVGIFFLDRWIQRRHDSDGMYVPLQIVIYELFFVERTLSSYICSLCDNFFTKVNFTICR